MSAVPTTSEVSPLLDSKVGDMTLEELSKALDGKVGLGTSRWAGIIFLFLIAVVFAIIAFVVIWIVYSRQISQENGGKNYTITRLTTNGSASSPTAIEHSTTFIYSVNATGATGHSITTYVAAPSSSIVGAQVNFVTNLEYSANTSTALASSATLNVVSATGDNAIAFTFLNGHTGASFRVPINGLQLAIGGTIPAGSYTVSRMFIWQSTNSLVEVDKADGFIPLLLG
jgi:hypothetical protein